MWHPAFMILGFTSKIHIHLMHVVLGQSGDRAVLEMFRDKETEGLDQQLVAHFVNPGEEIGGDSRLMSPPSSRIRTRTKAIGSQASLFSSCTK